MAEYIEREALIERLRKRLKNSVILGWLCSIIAEIPAADVEPVRHGRWIGLEYDGYADGCPVYDLWECSECGEEVRGEDVPDTHPWCHGCGAKMDVPDINVGDKEGG